MTNGVGKEIEEMLGDLAGTPAEPPAVEPPPVEPPPAEPPAEPPVEPPAEPPVEPKPGEPPVEPKPAEPPVEPPVEPPAEPPEPPIEPPAEPPDPRLVTPPVEPPVEPHEETSEEAVARLEAQNAKLMEWNERILAGEPVTAGPPAAPAPGTPGAPSEPAPVTVEPTPAPAPPAEIKIDEINFLEGRSQEDIERIVENPVELNKVLNQVYLKAIEQSIPIAQERSLLAVPQVVVAHIQRYNKMKGLVDDFYKENADLKVAQRAVGMLANEVHSEHTDWTTKQVFDEAAVRTRKALGMPEPPPKPPGEPGRQVVTPAGEPVAGPAFANPTGSRQRGPAGQKLSGMAKEIDDLMPDKD